jgi:hypothetical protein
MVIVKFAEKPRRSSVFQRLVCGDRRLIQLNFLVWYSLPPDVFGQVFRADVIFDTVTYHIYKLGLVL